MVVIMSAHGVFEALRCLTSMLETGEEFLKTQWATKAPVQFQGSGPGMQKTLSPLAIAMTENETKKAIVYNPL